MFCTDHISSFDLLQVKFIKQTVTVHPNVQKCVVIYLLVNISKTLARSCPTWVILSAAVTLT